MKEKENPKRQYDKGNQIIILAENIHKEEFARDYLATFKSTRTNQGFEYSKTIELESGEKAEILVFYFYQHSLKEKAIPIPIKYVDLLIVPRMGETVFLNAESGTLSQEGSYTKVNDLKRLNPLVDFDSTEIMQSSTLEENEKEIITETLNNRKNPTFKKENNEDQKILEKNFKEFKNQMKKNEKDDDDNSFTNKCNIF